MFCRQIRLPKTSKLRIYLFFTWKTLYSLQNWFSSRFYYMVRYVNAVQYLTRVSLIYTRYFRNMIIVWNRVQLVASYIYHFLWAVDPIIHSISFCILECFWLYAHVGHLRFLLCLSGIENASDIALYSGLGAAVVAVAVLVIGVTLYRRSQSDYGVDVIDSSALTGGFQTFNFKTVRQGQRRRSPQHLILRTVDYAHTQPPVFFGPVWR